MRNMVYLHTLVNMTNFVVAIGHKTEEKDVGILQLNIILNKVIL